MCPKCPQTIFRLIMFSRGFHKTKTNLNLCRSFERNIIQTLIKIEYLLRRICLFMSIWNGRTNFNKKKIVLDCHPISQENGRIQTLCVYYKIYLNPTRRNITQFRQLIWQQASNSIKFTLIRSLWMYGTYVMNNKANYPEKGVLHFTVSIKIYWVEVN